MPPSAFAGARILPYHGGSGSGSRGAGFAQLAPLWAAAAVAGAGPSTSLGLARRPSARAATPRAGRPLTSGPSVAPRRSRQSAESGPRNGSPGSNGADSRYRRARAATAYFPGVWRSASNPKGNARVGNGRSDAPRSERRTPTRGRRQSGDEVVNAPAVRSGVRSYSSLPRRKATPISLTRRCLSWIGA